MTTDAAIMADLNFGGIDKANPRATTKTMLPVDTNRVEVEMLKITVVVLMESDQDGHHFASSQDFAMFTSFIIGPKPCLF